MVKLFLHAVITADANMDLSAVIISKIQSISQVAIKPRPIQMMRLNSLTLLITATQRQHSVVLISSKLSREAPVKVSLLLTVVT